MNVEVDTTGPASGAVPKAGGEPGGSDADSGLGFRHAVMATERAVAARFKNSRREFDMLTIMPERQPRDFAGDSRATLWRMADQDWKSNSKPASRRQFGKGVGLAAAGILSSPALAAQAALPAVDEAAVDAKYANVIRKYGTRLSPAQRRRVRETLIQHQRMLARVREFALENGDAPATRLGLYPGIVPPAAGRERQP